MLNSPPRSAITITKPRTRLAEKEEQGKNRQLQSATPLTRTQQDWSLGKIIKLKKGEDNSYLDALGDIPGE